MPLQNRKTQKESPFSFFFFLSCRFLCLFRLGSGLFNSLLNGGCGLDSLFNNRSLRLGLSSKLFFNQFNDRFSLGRDLAYPEQIALYLTVGFISLIVTSYLTQHHDPEAVRRFYRKMRTPTTKASEFDADD